MTTHIRFQGNAFLINLMLFKLIFISDNGLNNQCKICMEIELSGKLPMNENANYDGD